jgi:hypothetical protein
MKKKIAVLMSLVFVYVLIPMMAFAQQEAGHEEHHPAEAQAQTPDLKEQEETGQQATEDLMSMNEQMMKRMDQMNQDLQQKLAAMNAATGPNQIEAIKAVINEMASQRKELMGKRMAMQGKMCKMMGRMSGGGMSSKMGGMDSMMGPGKKMMKGKEGQGGEKKMIVIIQE